MKEWQIDGQKARIRQTRFSDGETAAPGALSCLFYRAEQRVRLLQTAEQGGGLVT